MTVIQTQRSHPAKFTDVILDEIEKHIPLGSLVLDPFAGVGRVHELAARRSSTTWGVEIEPEWANVHPQTIVANALHLPFRDDQFDVIVVSPCYGNRMADHHDARDGSRRMTYTHTLGRELHPDNAGKMQWGATYRDFHERAWGEAVRVCGNKFILNISNHIRKGEVQPVMEWHLTTLITLGMELVKLVTIETPRMRYGENRQVRVGYEAVAVFLKV